MISESLRRHVLAFATAIARDADEAEDITQVVLFKLHREPAAFRGECALSTWLFHITKNVALGRRRREARRSALLARSGHRLFVPATAEVEEPIVGTGLDRIVNDSLRRLPPRQHEVFELMLRGSVISEIAARLAIAPASVRASLCKARRTLQADLRRMVPVTWAERASPQPPAARTRGAAVG